MIRVNLMLRTPPHAAGRRRWLAVPPEQRAALAGLALLVATVGLVVASWWRIGRERIEVEAHLVGAEAEMARLRAAAGAASRAAERAGSLERRLALVGGLRAAQRAPGDALDAIVDSLTDGLWLTELVQHDAGVELHGRAMTLGAVIAFIDRLQASDGFSGALEIVETGTVTAPGIPLVRFVVRGVLPATLQAAVAGGDRP